MFNREKILKNSYEFLNALNIIYYLTISVPLVLFGVLYLRLEKEGGLADTTKESFQPVYHLLIPLLTLLCFVYAFVSYKKKFRQLNLQTTLQEKLLFFYKHSVRTYMLLLLAGLLPLISLYMTGEQIFAGLYAISLVGTSFKRPMPARVVNDLRLTKEEQQRLLDNQPLTDA